MKTSMINENYTSESSFSFEFGSKEILCTLPKSGTGSLTLSAKNYKCCLPKLAIQISPNLSQVETKYLEFNNALTLQETAYEQLKNFEKV